MVYNGSFVQIAILLGISAVCGFAELQKRGTRETSRKGDPGDEMQMDTNFDFNFKWDEEPPEFISQLDLEVKWDDDEDYSVNKSSKVSLRNVTVNGDYDITGPITNMITQVVNHSYHERLNGKAVKPTPLPKSHQVPDSNQGTCSCEEFSSFFKDLKILKGDKGDTGKRGRRGHKGEVGYIGMKGDRGEPGPRGIPGLSVVGPKGEPGDPGILPHHLLNPDTSAVKGEPGPRGPPGRPGICLSSCAVKNEPTSTTTPNPPSNLLRPSKPTFRIVPGALVFKTLESMNRISTRIMLGSVAFVEETEQFYGKVTSGWRQFQMGPFPT